MSVGVLRVLAIGTYASVLRNKAAERDVLQLLEEFGNRVMAADESPEELLADLSTRVHQIETGAARVSYQSLAETVPEVVAEMVRQRDRVKELLGISTGIACVDESTTGYRNGELTYVGAAPGRGKTSWLLQGMYAAALQGHRVGLISLEMRKDQLMRRLALLASTLKPWQMRDARKMNGVDFQYAMSTVESLGELPIFASDQDGLRPHEITSMARRMVKQDGVEILFVDFVQVVVADGRTQKEGIDKVSAALRSIAKTLNIPVVAASQITRRDGDVNRVPTLHDLRESGNLEQDAHNVLFLYRPTDRETQRFTGEDQVVIAKSREGEVGALPVTYNSRSLSYVERSTK